MVEYLCKVTKPVTKKEPIQEFFISEQLKEMLKDIESRSTIAKKILNIKTTAELKNYVNFLDIAKDDPNKISYLDESRTLTQMDDKKDVLNIKIGDIVLSTKDSFINGVPSKKYYTIASIESNLKYRLERDHVLFTAYIHKDNISENPLNFSFRKDNFEMLGDFYNPDKRYMSRAGRLITKMFGDEFGGKEVSKFVESFCSVHPSVAFSSRYDYKIVSGDDIRKYYWVGNYDSKDSGTLGSSCMRHESCQKYFGIYTKNPDQVSMFIALNKFTQKIVARCIIWNDKYFDRIYSKTNEIAEMTIVYLEDIGYKDIYNPSQEIYLEIELDYGEGNFSYYPYLDTFYYLSGNSLYNYEPRSSFISLNDTEGQYDEWDEDGDYEYCDDDEYSGMVFSGHYGGIFIKNSESVYASDINTNILREDAILDWSQNYILKDTAIKDFKGRWVAPCHTTELYDGKIAINSDWQTYNICKLHDDTYACSRMHDIVHDYYTLEWILEEDAVETTYPVLDEPCITHKNNVIEYKGYILYNSEQYKKEIDVEISKKELELP